MIVHRLQQEFDDNIVDGLGRLLGGVGNRLKQVKEKVGQRVAEVAETVRTDYEENFSLPPPKPPQDDGVEDALKIKNDEIKRMRREFEVTIKAKEMEVEELTSRIVALEVGSDEEGGREGGSGRSSSLALEAAVASAVKRALESKEAEVSALMEKQKSMFDETVKAGEERVREAEEREEVERGKAEAAGKALEKARGEADGEKERAMEGEIKGKEAVEGARREAVEARREVEEVRKEVEEARKEAEEARREAEEARKGKVKAGAKAGDGEAAAGDGYGEEMKKRDEEIGILKEEIVTWQGRAQKCRDDRTNVVGEKKKSDAAFNATILELKGEVEGLREVVKEVEREREEVRKRLGEMERGEKESVRSAGSSGVMVQSAMQEEGEEEGWGGWGEDDE